MIRAIVWDVGGTLVETQDLWLQSMIAAAGAAGVAIRQADIARFEGRSAEAVWDYLAAECGLEMACDPWMEAVSRHFANHAPAQVRARSGVKSHILLFASMGLRQAAVSNMPAETVAASLGAAGILKSRGAEHPDGEARESQSLSLLEFTVSLEEGSKPKPDPELYRRALRRLGLTGQQCLAVEDTPAGARAAKAAGIRVLAWPKDPQAVFDEIDYLTDRLEGPDWVHILRARKPPRQLIARSLQSGIPKTAGDADLDFSDGPASERHPSSVPRES